MGLIGVNAMNSEHYCVLGPKNSMRRALDKVCQKGILMTMATMNVSLPDPMKSWVEAQTKDGRYSNASDYVRDLIRRDQEREQALAEIQALVTEGIESGEPEPFDMKAYISRKQSKA